MVIDFQVTTVEVIRVLIAGVEMGTLFPAPCLRRRVEKGKFSFYRKNWVMTYDAFNTVVVLG
ncbi:hypothetical protein CCACVL1_12570 [Corchorus capsularis]|uniref:Uncharacterized protein n=1 Tax=Corchorus capsularis TaxID=210143 RepID=A0A1R3IF92_COCAP|nr:hypothetical protein CCACVL1_12570 [Corchorus capsularis]